MSFYHQFDTLTNTRGDSLPGYRVIARLPNGGAVQPIYSDINGTPIIAVSGIANTAVTDADGNYDFFITANNTYDLEYYSPAGVFLKATRNVPMIAGIKGDTGQTGSSNNTRLSLAELKAAAITDGTSLYDGSLWSWQTVNAPYTSDDVNVVKADSTALTSGAWVRQNVAGVVFKPATTIADGVVDDGAAFTAALASTSARVMDARGRFAASHIKFPGAPVGSTSRIRIIGDPVFVQAAPNTPIAEIQNSTLQQSCGHVLRCTVIPHPGSSKSNPNNIAVNLTGFSAANIEVTLGNASSYGSDLGRFHTVIYGDSASPYCYGNKVRLVANSVQSPKYGIRLSDRGAGVGSNPNINQFSAWCVNLNTVAGDVLVDLSYTTHAVLSGPTLLEMCPNAIGARLGNMSTVQDAWVESLGTAFDMGGSVGTTPNNCTLKRVYFSGAHNVIVMTGLLAPPTFDGCVNDQLVTYVDQNGNPTAAPMATRGYPQPACPTLAFTVGSGAIVVDRGGTDALRLRTDHHGRTTFQPRWLVTPSAAGNAQLRLTAPSGFAVEQALFGVRDLTTLNKLSVALGDSLAGTDYDLSWATTNQHVVNAEITLRATS